MPLHADDIAADIMRQDRDGLEEAFRALVGWPKEALISGTTATRRRALLSDVCEALISIEDGRAMPGATLDLIIDAAEDVNGPTYCDGARAVLQCRPIFSQLEREVW